MKDKLITHRVITLLTREELEFLDKLGKDVMFSTGKHMSRSRILQDAAELLLRARMDAVGVKSDEELLAKMKAAVAKMEIAP